MPKGASIQPAMSWRLAGETMERAIKLGSFWGAVLGAAWAFVIAIITACFGALPAALLEVLLSFITGMIGFMLGMIIGIVAGLALLACWPLVRGSPAVARLVGAIGAASVPIAAVSSWHTHPFIVLFWLPVLVSAIPAGAVLGRGVVDGRAARWPELRSRDGEPKSADAAECPALRGGRGTR